MANISNAVFEFTEELISSALPDSPLFDKSLHADIYEAIKSDTVRVDDLRSATPVITADQSIRKDNAILNVFFIAFPESQKLADRLAARQRAEDMADEWLLGLFENPKMRDGEGVARICNIGRVQQFNDWIRPSTVKMPVCILKLEINPRG